MGHTRKLLVMATAVAALLSATGVVDKVGRDGIVDARNRAFASFAVARGLNAIISFVQGTETSFQPLGVGVTLAPGQFLDPLNDIVERFSWVMLASSVSLAVQALLLDLSSWGVFVWIATLFGVASLVLLVRFRAPEWWASCLIKIGWFLLFLRFVMPAFILLNESVYAGILAPGYQEASQGLESASTRLEELRVEDLNASDSGNESGLLEKAKQFFGVGAPSNAVEGFKLRYDEQTSAAASHAVELASIFIFQTLVSPLLFLVLLVGLVKGLRGVAVARLLGTER